MQGGQVPKRALDPTSSETYGSPGLVFISDRLRGEGGFLTSKALRTGIKALTGQPR